MGFRQFRQLKKTISPNAKSIPTLPQFVPRPVAASSLSMSLYTNHIATELLDGLQSFNPVFPPKILASYSNVGFDLLGLVLANVTGMSYEDYITSSIIEPLGLQDTSFTKPEDLTGVIPADSYWNVDLGVGNP
jgi:CubicO group peptidase (beta-lactamase class C family)